MYPELRAHPAVAVPHERSLTTDMRELVNTRVAGALIACRAKGPTSSMPADGKVALKLPMPGIMRLRWSP